ncbi:purine-nucleoside phosphorylase [Mycoplasmopsis columbina]|uniref:purine-nucleoside phosphorylase n=1 Tax=Mycoplasmopsis columbina TaxID=114881 RepID=UPI0004A76E02|nr:purine-nucleoside phosphorylase [Mycoplasmopsis columbina]VEU77140.1 purine-nucleoside phosphorylase [Mycoplasmopsis columbina]
MSTHIGAEKNQIANIVLLSGDPLRAKYMAYKYLDNVELVNSVRGELFFTGYFKGKKVTIGGSGMGMMSIGVYAHELYADYNVDLIIRLGSTGSYVDEINLFDVVIINRAYSDNVSIAQLTNNETTNEYFPDENASKLLKESAEELKIPYKEASVHSTDVFYAVRPLEETKKISQCQVVECESYALFAVAKKLNKKAATILQVSDSLAKMEFTDSLTRERKFTNMFEIALNMVKNFK